MDRVVHFEIPYDDRKRAMEFYADTFGWQLNELTEMEYVLALTTPVDDNQMPKEPGAINGGLFKRSQEAPRPVIYVAVESVDASIDKVTGAGGEIVTPRTEIPGMGAYARVTDTEGNIIGIFESR
jgi:predicted enzyme related to lactoylglutathione lyase